METVDYGQLAEKMRDAIRAEAARIAPASNKDGFAAGGSVVIVLGKDREDCRKTLGTPFAYPIFDGANTVIRTDYGETYTQIIVLMKIANAMQCNEKMAGLLSGICPAIAGCSERTGMVNYLGALAAIVVKDGEAVLAAYWGASGATAKNDLLCAAEGIAVLRREYPEEEGYKIYAPSGAEIANAILAYDVAKGCGNRAHNPLIIGRVAGSDVGTIDGNRYFANCLEAQGAYPVFPNEMTRSDGATSAVRFIGAKVDERNIGDVSSILEMASAAGDLRSADGKKPDAIVTIGSPDLAMIIGGFLGKDALVFNVTPTSQE